MSPPSFHVGEIQRLSPGAEWDGLVSSSPFADTYFRPGYVTPYWHVDGGRAAAIVAAGCLVPFCLAPLHSLPFEHRVEGFDAISPYGFGGLMPLAEQSIDCGEVLERLLSWARPESVVCCFLRLHPLLPISEDFRRIAAQRGHHVRMRGVTTGIRLAEWDEQRDAIAGMSKGRMSDLSKARRHVSVEWARLEDPAQRTASLELFQTLYNASLDRLKAAPFYRFPHAYYEALAEGLGKVLGLAFALHDDKPVAASMFFFDRYFAHYHFSCSTDQGREFRANTLLINAAAQRARQQGCRLLHLGGGSQAGDSVWRFKESFCGPIFEHYTANLIVDPKAYDTLVAARKAAPGLPPPSDAYVFYRT